MLFNPDNFLTHLKNLVTGGGYQKDGVTPTHDCGFLKDDHISSSLIAAAASTTAIATLSFLVPRDYDEATDTFFVEIEAKMAGATDTPTVTLAPTKNGSALVASSGTLVTAALSATATRYTFLLDRNGLKRNDFVSLVLTSGAHTTDALNLLTARISYRSTLVSYNETDGVNPNTGNALR